MDPHDDAEGLRRRLYGPEATEDDVRRYLAAAPAPAPVEEDREPDPPRRARRTAAMIVGVAAVAAAAVLVPALQRPAAAPSASPAPTQSVVVLPSDEPDVVYADAGTVLTYRGRGSRTVPLTTALAPRDGSLTIAVDGPRPLSWYVARSPAATGDAPDRIRIHPDGTRDDDVPFQLDYTGAPPDEVVVTAADRSPWTIVVTFLRARTPA